MSLARSAARIVHRQRSLVSSRITSEAPSFGYATALAGTDATKVVIVWDGVQVEVPKFQVYAHKMPAVGDRVLVHDNDGEVNIAGVSRGAP
jgi:hypothetical protein